MPLIRRKSNMIDVYLAPHVVSSGYPACGQSVPVLIAGRQWIDVQFDGWINEAELSFTDQTVKITGISGFSPGNSVLGPWENYCKYTVLLGGLMHTEHGPVCYMALRDGAPVAWCEIKRPG